MERPLPTVRPPEQAPRPVGGWGLLTGGIVAIGILVLMSHARDLGITEPLRVLGSIYGFDQYREPFSAAVFLATIAIHLRNGALAVALAAAALAWGVRAVALVRVVYPDLVLRELLAFGAGFSVLGLVMLGGGLAGLWFWWWPAAWIAAGVVLAWSDRDRLRILVPSLPVSWGGRVVMVVTLFAAAFIVLVGLSPEVFYDSLVYHLADPFNWVKVHKVTHLPYNFFSNFSFTFEMLFAIGLLFGSDVVAKLVHVAIAFAAAGLVGWTASWLAGSVPVGGEGGASGVRPLPVVDPAIQDRRTGGNMSPNVPFAERSTMASKEGSKSTAWTAACIYLTTPLIATSAWLTGIDAGMVLYETAAVVAFLLWWDRRSVPWLLMAGVFGGLGMGVKYTVGLTVGLIGLGIGARTAAPDRKDALRGWLIAILVLAVPVTVGNIKEVRDAAWLASLGRPALAVYAVACVGAFAWLVRRWGTRPVLRGILVAALFGAVVALCVVPWNLKSFLFTRNPVYPFAFHVLDGLHISPWRMDYQMGEFREFQYRPFSEWLTHPWHLVKIAGLSNNSACGALFLAFLPLLLVFRGVGEPVRLLGTAVLGRYLLWANISNIIRYFVPGLALMGVLIAVFVDRICARRAMTRVAGMILILAFTAVNVYAMLVIAQGGSRFWGVVLGLEKQRDYFLAGRPSYPCPPYAACEAMNSLLPPRAGVLLAGEARGYFYRGRLIASTVFDFPVLLDVCAASRTPDDVNRKLKQLGMTHVFFNEAEAGRIAGYRIFDWPDARQRDLFERWWTGNLSLVWQVPWLEVYRIVPAGVREKTAALRFVQAPLEEYKALSGLEGSALQALQQSRFPDALSAAKELVKRAPGVARSHELVAQVLSFQNRDRESLAEFRKALALGMVSSRVHYNMSIMLRRLGDNAGAAAEYRKFTELEAAYSK